MSFEETLARLAVRVGLNLKEGQEVFLTAHVEQLPLVRAIAREVYQSGGVAVVPFFADDELARVRLLLAREEALDHAPEWLYRAIGERLESGEMARLAVAGEDPRLLADVPPERLSRAMQAHARAYRPVLLPISRFATNWTIVGYPVRGWARAVFPELPEEEALSRLKEAIRVATRLDAEDPLAEWRRRADELSARAAWLTERNFAALRFVGPGTDLTVGLAEGHVWKGGWGEAKNGLRVLPNIPTEEVFTMPHRERVFGRVRATMPSTLNGVLVKGLMVRFENGVAVEVRAEEGLEAVKTLLETDEGAKRLGEVALVPADSGVKRAGVLFLNTLFDENAASHIAFGQAYSENLKDADRLSHEERKKRGMNESLIHQDWMIGSEEMDVLGVDAEGREVLLMAKGRWAFSV